MDWTPTEMQGAIKELAGQVLKESKTPWADLAEAELLGVEDVLDITALIVEVGKAGGYAPAVQTLALGWPLKAHGAGYADDVVLTGALAEESSRDPRKATTYAEDGKLYGTKICVPSADVAEAVAVAAKDGVYEVKLADCAVELQVGTNDEKLGILTFDGTPATKLGGLDLLDAWLTRVHLGVAALHLGLAKAGLFMTAGYTRERKQFGRPIGSFQAVQQRAADAWIDVQAMELTLLQAAWRVSEGLDAEREVTIARYWSSEGSHRVLAAAQHLHGGFGFDRDYPLHRYFLTAKLWEFLGGGANAQLEALGDQLASA